MKLSAKFNLVLILVFAVGLCATGYLSWSILQKNAKEEVVARAGLMMQAALAMRGYTNNEVKPLLVPHMTQVFYPQTVPAYAATQAFEQLRKLHPDYTYKEATLNPTNPRDRAVDWEADIVEQFRNHAEQEEISGERQTPSGDALYLARPIQINDPGCLSCHSTPDVAPVAMVSQYGDSNGFGWKLKDVVGAQIVSVPMTVPIQQARKAFFTFMGTIMVVFVVIIVVLNVMLRRIVVTPVTVMAHIADEASKGRLDAEPFDDSGKDEIAVMAASFNRMRRSLEKAMKMLDD